METVARCKRSTWQRADTPEAIITVPVVSRIISMYQYINSE